jgi:hypothetical protein
MKNFKRILASAFLLALCIGNASAIDDLVISSFEVGATNEVGVSILATDASGFTGSNYLEKPAISDNPNPVGINTSAKCVTQVLKGTARRWGAITYLDFSTPITPAMMSLRKYMKVMVWREKNPNNFRISFAKIEDALRGVNWNDGTNAYGAKLPKDGEWVDLVIDLSKSVTSTVAGGGGTFKWMDQNLRSIGMQNVENATTDLGYTVKVMYDNIVLSDNPMPRGVNIFTRSDLKFGFENITSEKAYWLEKDSISAQSTTNSFEVIDNPVKTTENGTSKVMKFNKSATCNWWEGGPKFIFDGLIPVGGTNPSFLHSMVYIPTGGTTTTIPVTVQINATDWTGNTNQIEYDEYIFDTDKWVDIVLDVTTKLTHLKQIAIRFDVQKDAAGTGWIKTPLAMYYIDGIELTNSADPRVKLEEYSTGVLSPKVEKNTLMKVSCSNQIIKLFAKSTIAVNVYNTNGQMIVKKQVASDSNVEIPLKVKGIYCIQAIGSNGKKESILVNAM